MPSLQEREYVPLGGVEPIKADVRIVAATNRELASEVKSGRFRQDLYYRLNIVRVVLPPLRERAGDLPLLVDHFIDRFNALQGRRITAISESALSSLMAYDFPGNVRELENAIEHAFVICADETIKREDLPAHICDPQAEAVDRVFSSRVDPGPLENAEAAVLRESLARNGGNRSLTAQDLGISRNTLWRKMKKYDIH